MNDEASSFPITEGSCPYPKSSDQCKMPKTHENIASNSENPTNGIDASDNGLSENSRDIGISISNGENSNANVENVTTQVVNSPSAPYIDDFSDSAQGNILPIGFINITDQRIASEPPPPSYDQLFTPESTNVERPTVPDAPLTNHASTSTSSEFVTDNATDSVCQEITGVAWNGQSYVCSTGNTRSNSPNDNTTGSVRNKITGVGWNGRRYICSTGNARINNSANDSEAVNMTSMSGQKELLRRVSGVLGMIVVAFVIWMSFVPSF